MSSSRHHYAFPRRRGNNITLIGMPGCGKSTLGKVCAGIMGRDFIDTDRVLCEQMQVTGTGELAAILDFDGFVKAEEKAVRSVEVENTIIATGGSVVYSPRAMRHLQKLGPIIYIQVPLEKLEKRVHSTEKRGVILAPGQSFRDLYTTRHKLYHRYADMEFLPEDLDVKTSAYLLGGLITYMEKEWERYHGQETDRRY